MASTAQSKSALSPTAETLKRFRKQPTALFRGYFALAARNLPFTALQFPMFEALRGKIANRRKGQGKWGGGVTERAIVTGISAGLAGSVAAVITTPVDVVKTRVMLSAGDFSSSDNNGGGKRVVLKDAAGKPLDTKKSSRGPSEIRIAKEVWKEGGMKDLFRGGALRAVWTLIGSGLYLGVYDFGRVYLSQRRGKSIEDDDLF
jgi:solute carrier family 25 S-adenosylmethionine transporter 26